jgi:hypothetical protein
MKAYNLINKPQKWCKNYEALDNQGNPVNPINMSACRFCLLGAITRCYQDDDIRKEIYKKLIQINNLSSKYHYSEPEDILAEFNDEHTHKDVYSLLRKANV